MPPRLAVAKVARVDECEGVDMPMRRDAFGQDFTWGVASAAFQI
jgi:hypothetical protein